MKKNFQRNDAEAQEGKGNRRKVSDARLASFEILLKVEKEKAFSSVLLPLAEEKLETKDRALCHELTLGVLRKQIYLDKIIQSFTKKKIEKLDSEVLIALRLGLYQLVFLDKIPAYSAINEAVNLVHTAKKSSASGLVNAILRKAENGKSFNFEFVDEIEKISVETSHPRWLIEHWAESFGREKAEKIAAANNQTPALSFRLTNKSDERTIETLKKLGLEIEESTIALNSWQVSKSNDILRAFAEAGRIYFQEESSQLVGHAVNLQRYENFLDVCAAPGSKTTHVASTQRKTENGERKIEKRVDQPPIFVAGDKYLNRLRVLREVCERVGAENVQIINYNAEISLPFADETFDCVLVDAPCSGTGTIRHNPEIRYFLSAKDLRKLPVKQLKILQNASKILKTGGRLIYSTCSLEAVENEEVIEKFLSANKNLRKIAPRLPQKFLTKENFARTFPSRDETDGFFIATVERI